MKLSSTIKTTIINPIMQHKPRNHAKNKTLLTPDCLECIPGKLSCVDLIHGHWTYTLVKSRHPNKLI